HQQAYAWSASGFDGIAAFDFTITNIGTRPLTDVYAGLFADLDSRLRSDAAGHLDDAITQRSYEMLIPMGVSAFQGAGQLFTKTCVDRLAGTVPVVEDGVSGSGLPVVALVPMSHTTDPLASFTNDAFGPPVRAARARARAPARDTTFKF